MNLARFAGRHAREAGSHTIGSFGISAEHLQTKCGRPTCGGPKFKVVRPFKSFLLQLERFAEVEPPHGTSQALCAKAEDAFELASEHRLPHSRLGQAFAACKLCARHHHGVAVWEWNIEEGGTTWFSSGRECCCAS